MKYTPELLNRLHAELIDILSEIIRVCNANKIDYFILGGTAIGAFFYEDIIPWDDDIDIGMTRADYERFLKVAPTSLQPDYALQEFSTEPATPFYFAKVRKRGTLFVEQWYEGFPMEHGIYVDVFPLDRIPDNRMKEKIHRFRVRFWINCFTAKVKWLWRWFAPYGRVVDRPLPKSIVMCALIRIVSSLHSREWIYRRMNRVLGQYNDRPYRRVNIARMPFDQIERTAIENPVDMRFCGLTVKAPADVESYLRHHYKGLQKDVPVEQQVNHAPVELSFDTASGIIYRD